MNQQGIFIKQAISLVEAEQFFAVGFPEGGAVLVVETIDVAIAQVQQTLCLAQCVIDGVILWLCLTPVFALALREQFFKGFPIERGALFLQLCYQCMNNGLFDAEGGFAFVQIIRRAEPVMIFRVQSGLHLLSAVVISVFIATIGTPGHHKCQGGCSAGWRQQDIFFQPGALLWVGLGREIGTKQFQEQVFQRWLLCLVAHFVVEHFPQYRVQTVAFQHRLRVFQFAVVFCLLVNVLGNQIEQNVFGFRGLCASDHCNHFLIQRGFIFLFCHQVFQRLRAFSAEEGLASLNMLAQAKLGNAQRVQGDSGKIGMEFAAVKADIQQPVLFMRRRIMGEPQQELLFWLINLDAFFHRQL